MEEAVAGQIAAAESLEPIRQQIASPVSARKTSKQVAAPAQSAKSVRIALERLDRMMNTVGELVINRTRMVGRVAELAKLVEVLNFSKSRLSGKVSEFQEKHEF